MASLRAASAATDLDDYSPGSSVDRQKGPQVILPVTGSIPNNGSPPSAPRAAIADACSPDPGRDVRHTPIEPLQTFLIDASGALLRATPRQIHVEIEAWLARLVRLLSADRITVLQLSSEAQAVHSTHSAFVRGAPPFPVVATESEFEWLVHQVRSGETVQVPDLPTGLPGSAERERTLIANARIRSYVLVPFAIGDSTRGAIAVSSARPQHVFSEPVLARLQLFAEVIGSALARQQAWYTLETRVSFEHLLTDLVATLLGAAPEDLDAQIARGLGRVIGHFGFDRCSVLKFSDDHRSLSVVHHAAAPGISPLLAPITWPWYVERMRAGRVTQFTQQQADLPDDAIDDHQSIVDAGVRAHLSVPLAAAGRPWGAIGFSAFLQPRSWADADVQRLGMVGEVVMDALLSREAERKRRRQQDELARVARVAALGELTGALAHELNQPLVAIRLNAQATRRMLDAGQEADVDEVLGDIAADATRAGDLIRRLRDLLRRRELVKETLDVNEVITAIHGIAVAEAQRDGAELVIELTPELPPVLGDGIQLQQVVLNLVRNAAEAMNAHAGPREVRIRTWQTGGEHVTVSVEDDGPPIDDATLGTIFTPFLTTKPDGLGIGLAISRSIVEAHAGRLWAERRSTGGLAVRFALPSKLASDTFPAARFRARRRAPAS